MAGWEEELAVLLRELRVTQEEPKTHLRPAQMSEIPQRHRDHVKRRAQYADALFWSGTSKDAEVDDELFLNDLSLMRRQVESIVTQVIRLMQRGDIDPSLKEDVMVVLRALRRRASVTQQAAASETAYLESAAAMLHFCRLVLRLSEVASEET